ncbi:hypothetical protein AGDE_06154 [Angomonas deanei]|uniref:Uncharacterized protein n=1 Tax=Angomonas deanei TaxID=59799 RepID=A0A7G2CTR5_9TRYP|nr:hypothetical protein AGDE_06154 [Angomonas deanei]CAD2222461.1 hypothetical protein, conserved [Angomonas deanei]|eukprot:EPY37780.1 hypothetical protein AGDE_06154 [Angomonas deanei]
MSQFTHGVAGRPMKTKVSSNIGAPFAKRFYNAVWTYRLGQLTTSNMSRMKEKSIDLSYQSNQNNAKDPDAEAPVRSDLQPHALHKFNGEEDFSLLVCVPKSSDHYRNLIELNKASFMVGHTDPQLFHWFKQLGSLPPRSILSGQTELLQGDLAAEAWESAFVRHPTIHNLAQEMWEKNESKTEEEIVKISEREKEEDEKRMRRMSSSDWRSKFKDRERNPTQKEDEEKPVYVIKPETFALFRIKPDVRLWMNVAGQTQRVWEPVIHEPDPLCRCSHRFINMLNLARAKLVPSLNMNFSLKLTNAFIFEIDQGGLWALGTQENFMDKNGTVNEQWSELRLEFGQNQMITTEQEMEWWVRGLTKLGAPEVSQSDSNIDDAGMNPEDFEYRHI